MSQHYSDANDYYELVLPLELLRGYTKTDDSSVIEDADLILLRATAFEAYGKYSGALVYNCDDDVVEVVKIIVDNCGYIYPQAVKTSLPIKSPFVIVQLANNQILKMPAFVGTNTFQLSIPKQRCYLPAQIDLSSAKITYKPKNKNLHVVFPPKVILGIVKYIKFQLYCLENPSYKQYNAIRESGAEELW